MIIVDVNIVIYAHNAGAPQRKRPLRVINPIA